MRRTLRALSSVLVAVGVLLVVDAALTVTWQEPVSWAYSRLQQERMDDRLANLEAAEPTVVERRALARLPDERRRLAFAARSLERRAEPGEPVGRLEIPRIDLDEVVVAGTDARSLRRGPGHYPATPLPGRRGTVGIAGHRTTYGAPFRHLNRVRRGDRITVEMPYGRFEYEVERRRIVPPTAIWVTKRVSYDRLILSACHPLYSAEQRIVVFARLVSSEPRGSLADRPAS